MRFALANDEQNVYNGQQGDENNGQTEETNGRNQERTSGKNLYFSGRGSFPVSVDNGAISELYEIVRDREAVREISRLFSSAYTKTYSDTQENLIWHAENEDITLYFAKLRDNVQETHIYYRDNLFISDTAVAYILDPETSEFSAYIEDSTKAEAIEKLWKGINSAKTPEQAASLIKDTASDFNIYDLDKTGATNDRTSQVYKNNFEKMPLAQYYNGSAPLVLLLRGLDNYKKVECKSTVILRNAKPAIF